MTNHEAVNMKYKSKEYTFNIKHLDKEIETHTHMHSELNESIRLVAAAYASIRTYTNKSTYYLSYGNLHTHAYIYDWWS